jgi:hypothetical protein
MPDQVGCILITAAAANNIARDDRTYLPQIVSARTGMSTDDAQKRVDDVVDRAHASVTQAADTHRANQAQSGTDWVATRWQNKRAAHGPARFLHHREA